MLSKQDILNLAMMRLGNTNLINENQQYLDVLYSAGIKILLGVYYWSFSQRVIQLPLVNDTTEIYGYKYKYTLPSDMASLIKVYNASFFDNNYTIVGGYLHSNYTPLYLLYVSDSYYPDDVFPSHFGDMFAYWIAKEACSVLAKMELLPTLTALYEKSLTKAMGIDGKNKPTVILNSDYYINSRY